MNRARTHLSNAARLNRLPATGEVIPTGRPPARLPARAPNCRHESRRRRRRDMSVGIRTVVSVVVSRVRSSARVCLCDRVCGRVYGRVCPGGVYVVNSYAARGDTLFDSVRRAVISSEPQRCVRHKCCSELSRVRHRRNGVKMA